MLNPFKRGNQVPFREGVSHYTFANTMRRRDSKPLYERYAVPAASGVLGDIPIANLHRTPPTEVDFAKEGRIPLVFIGFGEDTSCGRRA